MWRKPAVLNWSGSPLRVHTKVTSLSYLIHLSSFTASLNLLFSSCQEICDLAIRITEGNLGRMDDLETWTEYVLSRSSFTDLVKFHFTYFSFFNR